MHILFVVEGSDQVYTCRAMNLGRESMRGKYLIQGPIKWLID
jgi:hypothetical protein